jgi:ribosomal protein L10
MKKEEKGLAVSELREKFLQAKVVILAEFSGMNVADVSEVKRALRAARGELKVVKNTIAIRAASGTMVHGVSAHFNGPTAVALGYADPVAPAKALREMGEKQKKLKIKAGVVEGRVIDLAGVLRVAQLPSKSVLQGQLVGRLKGPLYGLAAVLNGILGNFARTLKAVHEQRQASS